MDNLEVIKEASNWHYRKSNTTDSPEEAKMHYGFADAIGEAHMELEFDRALISLLQERQPGTYNKLTDDILARLRGRI